MQVIYLLGLLALLGTGSFLVVRQVLIRRALENAAKDLQDRVRMGVASAEEYFELGAVMLRKRLYIQANRYLEQAIQKWEGDPEELAQVTFDSVGCKFLGLWCHGLLVIGGAPSWKSTQGACCWVDR